MSRRVRRLLRRLSGRAPDTTPPRASPPENPPASPARSPREDLDPVAVITAYHDRTRHFPGRYARALGFLDWDSQPDPFRWFDGCPRVALPVVPPTDTPPYEAAFLEGHLPPRPLDADSLAQLLGDALGLSAWKETGDARWALRVDPSSGNLHPTEGYVICGAIAGLTEAPAVWHYQPFLHALERRAPLQQSTLPPQAVLIGLTSIPWRESWKYGERAFRYCQHDLGHVIGTVALAAAALGWRTRLLLDRDDRALSELLGTDVQVGPEAELPEALLWVGPELPAENVVLERGEVAGRPRALSPEHQDWDVIDQAAAASTRTTTAPPTNPPLATPTPGLEIGSAPFGLRRIVHQRRSAVDLDGRTGIERDAFLQILRKVWAGAGQVPFSTLPWRPKIHLGLMVHRVADLQPGLYLLPRDPDAIDDLWAAVDGSPEPVDAGGLPLHLLRAADVRQHAAGASCGQAIAADGCFAVAMFADFDVLDRWGPWAWRWLHWEAGLVGQALYLEAEASGIRGTGIGCFFDAVSQDLFGLSPARFRVVYHFTVGGPVDDTRLQTLPPYAHLDEARATAGMG